MAPPTQLPLRQVGKNGPMATALGFGAMGLSIAYGAIEYVALHRLRRFVLTQ
jgi:hypothetical protein